MKDWIQLLEFDTCVDCCEAPLDSGFTRISFCFPSPGFVFQSCHTGDVPIQTLTAEDTELDFGHIKPTAVLGCEMELQTIQDAFGFSGHKHFVQGSRQVGVQVVFHDNASLGIGEMYIYQITHTPSPIDFGATFCYFDMTPILERGEEHEQISGTFTAILVVMAHRLTDFH